MTVPNVVTVAQAADELGLTPAALYLAIKQKRLKAEVVLDRICIPRRELNRLLRLKADKEMHSNGHSAT